MFSSGSFGSKVRSYCIGQIPSRRDRGTQREVARLPSVHPKQNLSVVPGSIDLESAEELQEDHYEFQVKPIVNFILEMSKW